MLSESNPALEPRIPTPRRGSTLSTSIPAVGLALLWLGCASPQSSSKPAEAKPSPDAVAASTPAADAAAASPKPTAVESPEAWKPRPTDIVEPHQPLENAGTLSNFYSALAKIDDGDKGVVRVVHIGASMLGDDDLTSILREKFQTRFGDGGAGLVLLQRYMSNYRHLWVTLESKGWKNCFISYGCRKDGRYGLGGATFSSTGGASTTISTRQQSPGDTASRIELWYAAEKGGGKLELSVDDGEPIILDTASNETEDRYHQLNVPAGSHSANVTARGSARAYGLVLETEGPGLVWDQFSMLGAFTKHGLKWDPDHIAGQIERRDPALIAFTFGGNDLRRVAQGELSGEAYKSEYDALVKRVRAGKPSASCMIIGITDRARSLKTTILPKHVEEIVQAQRDVASENGCAFFDTYAAMGGGGSLRAWSKKDPPLAAKDLKHLTHEGRLLFGGWVYDALVQGYVAHRSK